MLELICVCLRFRGWRYYRCCYVVVGAMMWDVKACGVVGVIIVVDGVVVVVDVDVATTPTPTASATTTTHNVI